MKLPGQMAGEVLRHLVKKPATVLYPYVKVEMPADFRGKITFFADKCVGCKLCQKDCPSNAIVINKVSDKRFEAIFDLDHCIYCAQCVDSCNKDALAATKEYELAAFSRPSLHVVFDAPPAPVAAAAAAAVDPKPA
jgi:formate hydrogenlyase subunit 6/NADH:ubiquinone oxidoreductase subunit I